MQQICQETIQYHMLLYYVIIVSYDGSGIDNVRQKYVYLHTLVAM